MDREKLIKAWVCHWKGEVTYLPIFRLVRASSTRAKREYLERLLRAKKGGAYYHFEPDKRWNGYRNMQLEHAGIVWDDKTVVIPWHCTKSRAVAVYGQPNAALVEESLERLDWKNQPVVSVALSFPAREDRAGDGRVAYRQEFLVSEPVRVDFPHIKEFRQLSLEVQATLTALQGSDMEFVPYLSELLSVPRSQKKGDVFCAVRKGQIVGVCGPVDVYTDLEGQKYVAPCYFAVDEKFRRQGIGACLRAAMTQAAIKKGAAYKLFQAQAGSAADVFYAKKGLTCVGSITRTAAVLPVAQESLTAVGKA